MKVWLGPGGQVKIYRPHISNHKMQKQEKSVQTDPHQYIPEAQKKFARDMEQQFAKYMIEQMNKSTSSISPDAPGAAFYKDLINDEQSKMLTATSRGLGIQDVILDEIYPKYRRNEAAFNSYQKQLKDSQIFRRKYGEVSMVGPEQPKIKKDTDHAINMAPSPATGVQHE